MKTIMKTGIDPSYIDQFGHINHARYLDLLESARWDYAKQKGLDGYFHPNRNIHVVVRVAINYRRSAGINDLLRMETFVSGRGLRSYAMDQRVYLWDTEDLIVDAEITNVFIDSKTGKAIPIKEELLDLWPELKAVSKVNHYKE